MKFAKDISNLITGVQTVVDSTKAFAAREGNSSQNLAEQLSTRIEDMVAFAVGLSRTKDPVVAISLVMLYARTHYSGSYMKVMKNWFGKMSLDGKNGLDLFEKAKTIFHSTDDVELDSTVKNMRAESLSMERVGLREQFQSLRDSSIADFLHHMINALVIFGVAPDHAETMFGKGVYDYVRYRSKAVPSSYDVLDSMFYMIDWVAGKLVPAIVNKDFSVLLTDADVSQLNEDWVKINRWVDATARGQFDLVAKEANIKDEMDLMFMIEESAIAHGVMKSLGKNCPMNMELLITRIVKLNKMALDLSAMMHERPMREKPFGILIAGESGVNKSTVVNILNGHLCAVNGFRCDKNSVFHSNGDDKFQSEFRASHVTFIFDDMCNTKSELADGNPLMKIIQFLNNMHVCALSPEAEKKGKLRVMCKLGFVTTNKESLGAEFFSVNPSSIWRRFERILTVSLRPDAYGDDGLPHPRYVGQAIPDMWVFTVKKCVIKRMQLGQKDMVERKVTHRNMSIYDVLELLTVETRQHFAMQKQIVETATELLAVPRCPEHGYPSNCCVICNGTYKPRNSDADEVSPPLETINMIKQSGKGVVNRWASLFSARNAMPDEPDPETFDIPEQNDFEPAPPPVTRLLLLTEDVGGMLETYALPALGFGAIVLGVAGMWMMFTRVKNMVAQGGVLSGDERKPRDEVDSKSVDYWRRPVVDQSRFPEASRTTPFDIFEPKLRKNQAHLIVQRWEFGLLRKRYEHAQILPMGGGDWITTAHVFDDDCSYDVTVDLREYLDHSVGEKKFTQRVDASCWERIPDSDLIVLRLHKGGCNADFSKFLALKKPVGGEKIRLYALPDVDALKKGYIKENSTLSKVAKFRFPDLPSYYGYNYDISFPTFLGLCGAPVVQLGKHPTIVGFHSAGSANTPNEAGMCPVTYDEVMAAKKLLDKRLLAYAAQTPLKQEEFGIDYGYTTDIHPKNPLAFLSPVDSDEGFAMTILGQNSLPMNRFTSDVVKASYSDVVTEVMGLEREVTRPPTHQSYLHYQRDIKDMTSARPSPRPQTLEFARLDMERMFDEFHALNPQIDDMVKPISYEDAVNGIDGYLGIDRIDISTSMGTPINKPKKQFMTRVESKDHDVAYDFIEDKCNIRARVDEILADLKAGNRVNTIFKSNLKDEPITFKKLENHKVRVFSGSQVAFVIAYRMVLTPLFAMKRRYPHAFEAAVGCNAAGKDWDRLADFFPWKDRMVNGDYKAFDKTTHPQFVMAAYKYYAYMLRECGCSEDHVRIVESIATEVANPIYDVCGVIIEVCGSLPSGVPGTVDGNNEDNRLSLRCAYYEMHAWHNCFEVDTPRLGGVPLFHKRIKLSCYGDDNIMSVSPDETKFDHTSLTKELAQMGWTYTMSDKDSDSIPFITLDECDYLKRSFRYHEDLDARVGALQIPSIAKSLHMTKKNSPLCEGEQLATVAQGALAEFFLHGREEFEMRKAQLEKVIEIMDERLNPGPSAFMEWPTYESLVDRYNNTQAITDTWIENKDMQKQSKIVDEPLSDEEIHQMLSIALTIGTNILMFWGGRDGGLGREHWNFFRFSLVSMWNLWLQFLEYVIEMLESVVYWIDDMKNGRVKNMIAQSKKSPVLRFVPQWVYYVLLVKSERRNGRIDFSSYIVDGKDDLSVWRNRVRSVLLVVPSEAQDFRSRKSLQGVALRCVGHELRMLLYNEGQTIRVHCRGNDRDRYGRLSVGERADEVRRTYHRVCKMSQAWMLLQVYNSPLCDLLGRDVFWKLLETTEPSYEFISAVEFYQLGGYQAQADQFEYENKAIDLIDLSILDEQMCRPSV